MEGIVTLKQKEQNRLIVLNQIETDKLTVDKAATLLKLNPRHVWRLLAAYRKEGAAALSHGNRDRKPSNTLPEELRLNVLELANSKYSGFNNQQFTEKLAEKEGILLSRSSVRQILLDAGIRSPRRRRSPKHRSRRQRYPREGMLLQVDGSPHVWLEGRGPELCLIGAIDDATNKVPYAFFQEQEDTRGYMLMLREIVLTQGVPLALYHDRHSIFEVAPDKLPSIEDQLNGEKPLTQFGRLMEELGIESIAANSPQAKGRIERLWETFQDRLVSELRLVGASNREEANQVLADFLPDYNRKFAVAPANLEIAYRQLQEGFKSDEFFCFKYPRTVGADNVVRFDKHRLQILPSEERLSYALCKVEVQVRLDGSLAAYYQGQCLDTRPAPYEATALRVSKSTPVMAAIQSTPKTETRMPHKPSLDHPWRGKFRVHID